MTLRRSGKPYKASAGGLTPHATTRQNLAPGLPGVKSRVARGESSYTAAGNYQFVVPPGVFSISAVCIGHGGTPPTDSGSIGGGGGGLSYRNDIPVLPGEILFVRINATTGATIRRDNNLFGELLVGASSGRGVQPGAPIVGSGFGGGTASGTGGGGAAGYGSGGSTTAAVPSGGAGGGGGPTGTYSGGGGGVGLTGMNSSWVAPAAGTGRNGGPAGIGGSAGSAGACTGGTCCTFFQGGAGGAYGGGGGFGANSGGAGGSGGIRIIWPGELRSYPFNAA